jgi:hypothetical protein
VTGDLVPDVVFGAIAALLTWAAWDLIRRRRQVRASVPALERQGWRYQRDDHEIAHSFGHGYPFLWWKTQRFSDVLRGEVQGMPTTIATCSYYNQGQCSRTVVVMQLPQPLPRLASHDYEAYVKKGWPAFAAGGPETRRVEVSLRDDKGQQKDWHVWTEDDALAQAAVTPHMRDLTTQRPTIGWRIDGHAMIAWTRTLGPRDSLAVAERCAAILREIPSEAWAHGAREPDPWPGPCPERPA